MTSVKTLDRGQDPESPERFGRLTPLAWGAIIVGGAAVVYAALNSSRSVAGTRVGRPERSFVPSRTAFLGISNWYLLFRNRLTGHVFRRLGNVNRQVAPTGQTDANAADDRGDDQPDVA